ncbi:MULTISPECIES: DeoR family transcriptional regulator [Alteribacter]|uniref:DeoR/GlpR transcriptional regulator n=1 Tax=Alteribacter keqinensis TaxID=2483800 RepID=A0A3M7TTJ5_9BACI|nr:MULTISPECIES: DeoR family transcriptional regulator [Alteribacter]MBM7097454.1 DeoR/GlpR transcriptional regulator [Alteribacter salitolerans]RNA68609.1 DeoR/GlpR transcriptional regulator [Alteribacter keqinensis]
MLREERKKRILNWIDEEEYIRITELSKRLNVSEMTIYRDIQSLSEKGLLNRSSGGVTKKHTSTHEGTNICAYCKKGLHRRQQVQLIFKDQKVEELCCAHCGLLRYQEVDIEVSHLLCKDFLDDSTMSASMTHFLIGSDQVMNCCYPQTLPFASREQAVRFQKGFGGQLCTLKEALSELNKQMNVSGCCKDH